MTAIVGEGGRATLRAALAANHAAYALVYSTLPGGEHHVETGLHWFSSGVPELWFNGVLGGELTAPPTPAIVTRLIAHFARLRVPFL